MNRYVGFSIMALFANSIWANTHVHPNLVSPLANAFRSGTDTNGAALYLCKGKLFNSTQPGKTWPGYSSCNVAYGGKEYIVHHYTIPQQREFNHFIWARDRRGAVVVGRDTNGNPLFLCQSYFNGSLQPGKTWPGYDHCNISYAGSEIISNDYRVLTNNKEIVVRVRPPVVRFPNTTHSHY